MSIEKGEQRLPADPEEVASSVAVQQNLTDSAHNETKHIFKDIQSMHLYFAESCWLGYTRNMSTVNSDNWCEWHHINRHYSNLRICLEDLAEILNLAFPNNIANNYIMMGHRTYFINCTLPFQELADPPEHILLALILAPISIIPFLVTLVVCKSKTTKPHT
uniref:Receptor activity modifying protein 2 n=1 Tax=Xenopus tropicalis TaxID=8364 RepID=A0A803JG63_XENTR